MRMMRTMTIEWHREWLILLDKAGVDVFECLFCNALNWIEETPENEARMMRLSEVALEDCLGCVAVHESLQRAGIDLE